ncbi:MAG: alpha/beta fold hydrolase [Actinomycetia bacterium]|nr:alpha/beta fold hydrolase [Actinomycetes bacterium]
MLAVRRFGSGPPVVALHGFTLTGAQFAPAAERLQRAVIAPDLPGHGASPPASLSETVDDVAGIITSTGEPASLLGYSQGARIALLVALNHPDLVSHLILVSASAGIDDPVAQRVRAQSDGALAERMAAMTLDDFLDEWTTTGITAVRFRSEAEEVADRSVRSENTIEGLARALVDLGQGTQPSAWDRLADLTMPVLLVHGAQDPKYATISRRMAASIPDCSVVSIPGAGHNPFIDNPDSTYVAISRFLDGTS